ncbi:MAG: enamine deaminase RidA [Acidimicrobiaceae bacterium]|nr:enamine deaminase RidA [Acidimicrobiaceae bacterium]
MSLVQRLNPSSAPSPVAKYSQLSITHAGARIATFSGQTGRINGEAPASAAEQTRLAFGAIEALLQSQGATPADLVKLVTFVVGRENLAAFNSVRNEIYADWFPGGDFPSHTLVVVNGLAADSLLVEIEGSFACPPVP